MNNNGIAGLDFVNDIIQLLNNWKVSSGGKKPKITAIWDIKTVGFVQNNYREIIITLDAENAQIFSLLQGNLNSDNAYDWLHDVSISLDVRSGQSERDILQMVNETMRILKSNTVPTVTSKTGDRRTYLQLVPEGITSLNDDYHKIYRYMISVSALRFNP